MNKQDRSTQYSPYLNSRIKRCFDIAVCLLIVPLTIMILIILTITTFVVEGRAGILYSEKNRQRWHTLPDAQNTNLIY